ncbi:tolB protein precursor, periplasmic protein involved in the tonb-independent uptake of group A colicins [hydrothermal vent metagenome]|uniref:TolB protein, periplasmic protein involved in the tonb-independent uptake of group A colicins n=1 Tax=hydrothermal vent metagenome TaxID=652676 RepID=A0A1W1CD58_9ZZZZ
MKTIFFVIFILLNLNVNALLNVKILKSSDNAYPIVIKPLKNETNSQLSENISKIIEADLLRSGRFRTIKNNNNPKPNYTFLKKNGIEATMIGSIRKKSKRTYQVSFSLFDVFSHKKRFQKSWTVRASSLRKVAHKISDSIFFELLGEKGDFDTHLSYVLLKKYNNELRYHLEVSDSDAFNPQSILISKEPILSPSWSYDGQKLAYVSFENGFSQVFIKYVWVRRARVALPRFDGIASAPSWSPDGKNIVLTLSKKGNKDIYLYNLKSKKLKRLTTNKATDTEANFSPDGKSIVFSSDRGNGVQIYQLTLKNHKIRRLTFDGNYNTKPVFSPDGKNIVMVHRNKRKYRIALLNLRNRKFTIISNGSFDESPYFSPNGSMIAYATKDEKYGYLSVLSTNGLNSHQLISSEGEVREPSWSNF